MLVHSRRRHSGAFLDVLFDRPHGHAQDGGHLGNSEGRRVHLGHILAVSVHRNSQRISASSP